MFPIFFNFFGETQITIALLAHDHKSFYQLLDVLLKMQNCIESSFLLNAWLMGALRDGLKILNLLDSQIIQTALNSSIIEHWETWPSFHNNEKTISMNYDQPFLILLHDESAYQNLFENQLN